MCDEIQILLALATSQSFEGRLVSDVALVFGLIFLSAEGGTGALESPRVRQLTQAMTRVQKVNHYCATILHKSPRANTLASRQRIAENPNVRSIRVITGSGQQGPAVARRPSSVFLTGRPAVAAVFLVVSRAVENGKSVVMLCGPVGAGWRRKCGRRTVAVVEL